MKNITDNSEHLLHNTVIQQQSVFSQRLLQICNTDLYRRSFLNTGITIYNESLKWLHVRFWAWVFVFSRLSSLFSWLDQPHSCSLCSFLLLLTLLRALLWQSVFTLLSFILLPFVHLPDCLRLRLVCSLVYFSLIFSLLGWFVIFSVCSSLLLQFCLLSSSSASGFCRKRPLNRKSQSHHEDQPVHALYTPQALPISFFV